MGFLRSDNKKGKKTSMSDVFFDGKKKIINLGEKVVVLKFYPRRLSSFIYRYRVLFGSVIVILIFTISGLFFSQSKASVTNLYSTQCLGGWQHPENAEGEPNLSASSDGALFTKENSATLENSTSEIYCGNFAGEIPEGTLPKKFVLHLSWSVQNTPVITTIPVPEAVPLNTEETTTAIPTPEEVGTPTLENVGAENSAPAEETSSQDQIPAEELPPPLPLTEEPQALLDLFANRAYAAEENMANDFLEISYTLDGTEWKSAAKINWNNWEKGEYDIPVDSLSWDDLSHIQVKISPIASIDASPMVYLDSLWIATDYEKIPEVENPPKIILKDSSSIISSDTDFSSNQLPVFIVKDPKLTAEDISKLVDENKAEIVEDKDGILGAPKEEPAPTASEILEPVKNAVDPVIDSAQEKANDITDTIVSFFSPKIARAEESAKIVDAVILDAFGNATDITVTITTITNEDGTETEQITINRGDREFRPGRYTLKITLQTPEIIYISEQDFTWGVLAINTDRSIYRPNDNAYLQMGVLNDGGHTLCNADLNLAITSPAGVVSNLSTASGDIIKNPECQPDNIISDPDYYAHFLVPSEVGIYKMALTATTANGTRIIHDQFEVKDSVLFDVSRTAPTRIYPPHTYPVTLRITTPADWTGTVTEIVPASFEIDHPQNSQDYVSVETLGDPANPSGQNTKIISWNVSLQAGQEALLGYYFTAPKKSPEFYLLGPLKFYDNGASPASAPIFSEQREWQIASDATANIFTNTAGGNTWGTAGNWSQGTVPTATDGFVTTFDGTSPNCTVSVGAVVNSIDFTNYTNTITMSFAISSSGNVTLGANMIIAGTGLLQLAAPYTGTITSNGKAWPNNLQTGGSATSTITLADAWTVNGNYTASSSTVIMNGFTLNIKGNATWGNASGISSGTTLIKLTGTGTQTMSLTAQLRNNFTFASSGTVVLAEGASSFRYNSGTMTYTSGTIDTSAVTLAIVSVAPTFNTSGMTWTNFRQNSSNITTTLTSDFNVSDTATIGQSTQSQVINGAFNFNVKNLTVGVTTGTVSGTATIVINDAGTWSMPLITTGSVQNNLTFNAPGKTITVSGTVGYRAGTLTYTAGTMSMGTSTLNITGAATLNTSGMTWANVTIGALTLTLSSDLNLSATLTVGSASSTTTLNGAFNINVGGSLTQAGTSPSITGTASIVMNGTGTWSGVGTLKNNLTFNTSGTITVSGTVSYDTGTLTYTAGTMSMGGSTLSLALATTLNTNGMTWESITTAGSTFTLTLSSTLTTSGTFTEGSSGTITLGGAQSLSLGALTISTGVLQLSTSSVTVTGATSVTGTLNDNSATGTNILAGAVTINSGGIWGETSNPAFTFRGGLTENSSSGFTSGTGVYTFDTNAQTISGSQNFTITNLTNNVTTSTGLTFSGTQPTVTTLTQGTSAVLTFTGATLPTITTLTATATGNTVDYAGASQTCQVVTYYNLKISGSGTTTCAVTTINNNLTHSGSDAWTMTSAVAVAGNLTVSAGTVTTAAFAFTVSGTSEISGGTLANTNDTGEKRYVGLMTVDGGTLSGASSNIVFRGGITQTSGSVSITGTATFNTNDQALSGTQSIATVSVPTGRILTNNGTLTIGTDLNGLGTLTQGATGILNLGGTSGISTLTATASGNTVKYTSTTGGQTVKNTTYHNLTIDKSGQTATLGGSMTINGNLTITAGTLDADNTNNYSLIVKGNWANSGTFTPRLGTVTFNGGTTAAVTGATTFYNLTITHTSAKEVDFSTAGADIITVTNLFNVAGNTGELIKLYSNLSGTKWHFHPTGTATVDYADVKDGGCESGAITISPTHSTNSGNNDSCWSFFVPATSFSISDNSIGFGSLSALLARFATGDLLGSTSETEAHTLTASTNAPSGYSILINGNTLTSGASTVTAIGNTNVASSVGTKQFGLRMTASGGTGAVSAPYSGSGFALDTASFPDQVASESVGDSVSTTYSVRYIGNISATTTPGSYTGTITYIMVPNF